MRRIRTLQALLFWAGLVGAGACGAPDPRVSGGGDEAVFAEDEAVATEEGAVATEEGVVTTETEVVATEEDWGILRETAERAERQGLDTVSVGEAMAGVGLFFVGTPYRPRTLELGGPERLVVNLRALDCVTLIETTLAIVHTLREPGRVSGWTEEELRSTYSDALRTIRYRSGELRGYSSRLHYFSEWIRDAEEKGLVDDVTAGLGGVPDSTAVTFMSTHPEAYRQLSDSAVLEQVRSTEERISRRPRLFIPEAQIAEAAAGIQDGDIIVATSTVEGLDVAHTGIALWREGRLHLLHAPLVGDSVQVSPRTLARRIGEIDGQDGIMVARPLPKG